MTRLRSATVATADVIHAVYPSDSLTVCGCGDVHVLEDTWDSAPGEQLCPRCREAVAVLLQMHAF